ncbi:AAA family ATPase [Brevibacillus sp. NPDC058079]|uniref:AAA family ATPase n=1 Tax=Brevibacillus sp. NPDC058079 TaxID=3346330 RepID=UPI0036E87B49
MGTPNIVPELKRLLDAAYKREDDKLIEALEKIAVKFEKVKEPGIAEKIRLESVRNQQKRRMGQLVRMPSNKGMDMASIYTPIECQQKAKRLILNDMNKRVVNELIEIIRVKEEFEQHEVPLPNKVVMLGPPGTGKTLTAYYIAYMLDLPLVTVRLESIIDSHMGETASNLRKIFDYSKQMPCVLFLDEFDAIARDRGTANDMKELARVVNTLLQCLDDFDSESIVIAATNLGEQIDKAVWRRFDTRMTYAMPSVEERSQHLHLLLGDNLDEAVVIQDVAQVFSDCSYADIEQVIFKAKRKAIMQKVELTTKQIQLAFDEYKAINEMESL